MKEIKPGTLIIRDRSEYGRNASGEPCYREIVFVLNVNKSRTWALCTQGWHGGTIIGELHHMSVFLRGAADVSW